MNLRDLPLRWILLLAVVVGVGGWRIALALRPTEDVIRARIESLVDALEERQPKRIVRALTDDYRDAGGHDRRKVSEAARAVLLFGDRRLRGTLDPDDGFELLTPLGDDAEQCTVRIHCLIESRPSGTGASLAPFEPWWDLTLTADLVRSGGVWKIARTRDVNHRDRPRY